MDVPEITNLVAQDGEKGKKMTSSVTDVSPVKETDELSLIDVVTIDLGDSRAGDPSSDDGLIPVSASVPSGDNQDKDAAGNGDDIRSDEHDREAALRSQNFEVKPARYKGLGLFVKVDFAASQVICEEAPLIMCPAGAASSAEMDGFVRTAMADLPQEKQDFIIHALSNASSDRAEHHLAGVFRNECASMRPPYRQGCHIRAHRYGKSLVHAKCSVSLE